MPSEQMLGFTAAAILVLLLVFLALRWFALWYWRVNDQVALLREMAATLERIERQGHPVGATPLERVRVGTPLAPPPPEGGWRGFVRELW